jgi:hypothetical protein
VSVTVPEIAGFECQPRAAAVVSAAVLGGRIGHAYLLIGPSGIGKLPAALALGRLAACHAPAVTAGRLAPCGTCPSCLLPYEPDRHHDLLVVDPSVKELWASAEGSGAGREVKLIDRLREAQSLIALDPIVGRRRTLILPRIDSLQPVQLSVLLKTVEEPPPSGLILLTAANPAAVLPTILSRCQLIELVRVSTEAIVARLGRADEQAWAAAQLSAGRPEVARQLLSSPRFEELVEGLRHLARLALSGDALDALRAAELVRSLCMLWHEMVAAEASPAEPTEEERIRRSLEAILFPIEALVRDRWAAECGATAQPLTPAWLLAEAAPDTGRPLEQIRLLARAKRAVGQNASSRLALEALFLALPSA